MPTWDSALYRGFAEERSRPAVDLASRVALDAPHRIVDLGCGAGDSTAVVARRWPDAVMVGIDSSEEMLAPARAEHPEWTWIRDDIAAWQADEPRSI